MGRPKGTKNTMRIPVEKEKILNKNIINHESLIKLSSKYNVDLRLLKRWKKRYLAEGIKGLESKAGKKSSGRPKRPINLEEELKQKIMKLEIENARLKKGYQVKGVGQTKEYDTTFKKNMK